MQAALQAAEQQQAMAERARAELSTVAQAKTQMTKEWEEHVTKMAEVRNRGKPTRSPCIVVACSLQALACASLYQPVRFTS